jgi:aminopeptidase N
MKTLFFILVFIIFANVSAFSENNFPYFLENTFSGPLNYIEQPFDVLEYNLTIQLSTATPKNAAGHNQITVYWKNRNSDNQFIYHLVSLMTDSILIDGKITVPVAHGAETDADFYISAAIPGGIQSDTSIIDIYYSGKMISEGGAMDWGGVQYQSGILYNMGVGFNNKSVSAARHWMPCYDHPSDKAKFKAAFTVPSGKKVASNGLLVKTDYLNNGTDIIYYEHNYEIATYLMNFAMGDIQLFENKYNNIPIEIYSFLADSNQCRYFYKYLPKMAEAYEYYFGKYPFDKIGYVNTFLGSMEHQTMISLERAQVLNSIGKKDSLNSTVFHELAHQWFGDVVSVLDFRDVWFSESFADYSESLFYEYYFSHHASFNKDYGFVKYIEKTNRDMSEYFTNAIPYEGKIPLYNFKSVNPSASNYPYTIYVKGGVVLQMLRYKIGDEAFFAALKDIQANYKYKNITTAEVKSIFEKQFGSNLDTFFNQWIYKEGYPELKIITKQNTDNMIINIEQTQNLSWGYFSELPVNIKIKTENGLIDTTFIINEKIQNFNVALNSKKTIPKTDITINKSEKFVTLMKYNLNITDVNDDLSNNNYSMINKGNSLEVDYTSMNSNGITYEINDLLGNPVYKNQYFSSNGIFNFTIDINSLQSGSYYMILKDGKKLISDKFIKVN